MQDAADHPAVIHPMRPLAPPRQQGLKPKPLRIAQPVKLPHPSLPPTGSLNHEITSRGIPLLGTDPSSRSPEKRAHGRASSIPLAISRAPYRPAKSGSS